MFLIKSQRSKKRKTKFGGKIQKWRRGGRKKRWGRKKGIKWGRQIRGKNGNGRKKDEKTEIKKKDEGENGFVLDEFRTYFAWNLTNFHFFSLFWTLFDSNQFHKIPTFLHKISTKNNIRFLPFFSLNALDSLITNFQPREGCPTFVKKFELYPMMHRRQIMSLPSDQEPLWSTKHWLKVSDSSFSSISSFPLWSWGIKIFWSYFGQILFIFWSNLGHILVIF